PAPAGIGGSGGAPSQPGTQRPTECLGMKLPPRAVGKNPPWAVGPESAGLPAYWPTEAWKMETPEKLGFDAAKLMAAADYKTQYSSTQAVFVVRHGYVALEKYVGGFGANSTHESYSMAKSFSSGLIGIAIGEGKIKSTDEKICQYYPMQWDCADMMDPRSRITIEHAMNLTTGIQWSEDWRSTASGTNDAYNLNLLDTVLSRKATEEPGKTKRYSTGDPALLSGVLQQATGMTAFQYGKMKVFDVIGATSIRWNADTRGRTTTYAGLQATARDYAKYGYLYLNRGQWDGKQVVPAEWVDRTTQAKNPCEDWNQWLWHINPPIRLGKQKPDCDSLFCLPSDIADLPPEGFFAEGVNGQFVFVLPSADLVVVRLANDQPGSEHWDEFARGFLLAIFDAIKQ
ncbi:MAG TPA: serine hydrolase, partial [Polyangiales bacterium]|nr:serine hydrolase [Polyangiales bacterium]